MGDNEKIVIGVELTGQAASDIAKITAAVEKLGNDGSKSFKKFSDAFSVFSGTLASNAVSKAFSVAAHSAEQLFDILVVDGVNAAIATQESIQKLNTALILSGKYTAAVSKDLVEYSDVLQRSTKFSNDQVLETEALLATMGKLGGDTIKRATVAALDLSTALGIDLESATRLVGKAAAGEISTFQRYGVHITQGKDAAQTFANTLKTLEDRFGGSAKAQVDTFGGAVSVAQHAFEDFSKEIGTNIINNQSLVNVVKVAAQIIDEMTGSVHANGNAFQTVLSTSIIIAIDVFRGLVNTARAVVGIFGVQSQILDTLVKNLERLRGAAQEGFGKSADGAKRLVDSLHGAGDAAATLTKDQEKLIEQGKQIAQQTQDKSPDEEYIRKATALSAYFEFEQTSTAEQVEILQRLEQERVDKLSAIRTAEADAIIAQNQALTQDSLFGNAQQIENNQQKLAAILKSEQLSAKDRAKIQTAYTQQSKLIESQRAQAIEGSLNSLASLQTAKTKELAVIGKAAAIAKTTIDTFSGATAAASALAGIPLVGPALAAAAAAAFIAAGLANVARITGVNLETGLEKVPAGYPNDSFRANLSSDEGVLNRRDNRMLTLMARHDSQTELLGAIVERLDRLELRNTVYIGQKVIVDEFRDAVQSGRSL